MILGEADKLHPSPKADKDLNFGEFGNRQLMWKVLIPVLKCSIVGLISDKFGNLSVD